MGVLPPRLIHEQSVVQAIAYIGISAGFAGWHEHCLTIKSQALCRDHRELIARPDHGDFRAIPSADQIPNMGDDLCLSP
jgi:hypothetical protein